MRRDSEPTNTKSKDVKPKLITAANVTPVAAAISPQSVEKSDPVAYERNVEGLKVVNMGTAISETKLMDKWAASKRTQVSAILCTKVSGITLTRIRINDIHRARIYRVRPNSSVRICHCTSLIKAFRWPLR